MQRLRGGGGSCRQHVSVRQQAVAKQQGCVLPCARLLQAPTLPAGTPHAAAGGGRSAATQQPPPHRTSAVRPNSSSAAALRKWPCGGRGRQGLREVSVQVTAGTTSVGDALGNRRQARSPRTHRSGFCLPPAVASTSLPPTHPPMPPYLVEIRAQRNALLRVAERLVRLAQRQQRRAAVAAARGAAGRTEARGE